jgi:hypothetical protein
MTDERTFNILELYCFPKGCHIEKETQPYLATVLVPKLEAVGMKTAEWTRGALMLEEPYLSTVKSVVCRRCMHFECEHNTTPQQGNTGDILSDIFNYRYGDRQEGNVALFTALLPETVVADWTARGLTVTKLFVRSSRNQFSVSFDVVHPQRGKLGFRIHHKKGGSGKITVFSGSSWTDHPLPRTSETATKKLQELVTAVA